MIGFDYAYGRPSAQGIRDAGGSFVMRYLSPQPNTKNLDVAEVLNLRSGGIGIGLVWESYAKRPLEGSFAGMNDAREAERQARELGLFDRPIFFAVDWDVQPFQYGAVDQYFTGVRSVLGDRVGCYAGYSYLSYGFEYGVFRHGWQTEAWSRGHEESRASLIQRIGTVVVDGVECDKNDAYNSTFLGDVMTSPDPVALQPWEYRRMEERILSMSQGVPGQNFDGDQFKREQGWRDSVDAKLADIGKQLADLAAKPSGVTGTFPVTGNVKVG